MLVKTVPCTSTRLKLDMNTIMKKRDSAPSPNHKCPFCQSKAQVLEDEEVVLLSSSNTSFLKKNKYPIIQNADMYVLIESNHHDLHFEELPLHEASFIWSFAFDSLAMASTLHPDKKTLLMKNRGHLSGGSQPHPHMQVVSIPFDSFNPDTVNFGFTHSITSTDSYLLGLQVVAHQDLFQIVLHVPESEVRSKETLLLIQTLLKWTVEEYQNYNLVHWQENGVHQFKIIPRWAGSAYSLGYNNPLQFSEESLVDIGKELYNLTSFIQTNTHSA